MRRLILVILLITALSATASPPALSNIAPLDEGQDAGYYWWDSNESSSWAPDTEWYYPTNATGFQADDDYFTYNLPFDITFCGDEYAQGEEMYISSNGFIAFRESAADEPTNQDLPSAALPNALVAAFWDNLHAYGDGEIYIDIEGSAPERRMIVTYSPWYFYNSPYDELEFQIFFYETDVDNINNTVEILYNDVYGDSWRDAGASATVGVENFNGSEAAQYSYNQTKLANDLGVRYVDKVFVDSQVGSFNLLTPPDGSTHGIGQTINFTWEEPTYAGDGTVTYDLYIADNPDFEDPIIIDSGTAPNDSYIFGTGDNGTYYWKVIAAESTLGLTRTCNDVFSFDVTTTNIVPSSWGVIKALD
jgi:hypothetical protein